MIQYQDGGIGDMAKVRTTPEGGFAVQLLNKTGAASIKGTLVCPSTTVDLAVMLQNEEYDTFGVIWESGVADGDPVWVVTTGLADVLLADGTAADRRNLMITSATDGRAEAVATMPPPPNADTHFKEIGHCLQSVAAGADVLCRCAIHFN